MAKWVAEDLGLDDFFAEVLPHEKAEAIKKSEEYIVAMGLGTKSMMHPHWCRRMWELPSEPARCGSRVGGHSSC